MRGKILKWAVKQQLSANQLIDHQTLAVNEVLGSGSLLKKQLLYYMISHCLKTTNKLCSLYQY